MIRFYFHPTPNPAKIGLFLEEAGLDVEVFAEAVDGKIMAAAVRATKPAAVAAAAGACCAPGCCS